jgi:hypothetical protein
MVTSHRDFWLRIGKHTYEKSTLRVVMGLRGFTKDQDIALTDVRSGAIKREDVILVISPLRTEEVLSMAKRDIDCLVEMQTKG